MDCSGGTASSWHTRSSEYTCELMETTTVSTKHAWVKAVKFSALRSRSVHKTPPLNKKLHATVTCWPRKNHFFFPMECHWVYISTTFQGRTHAQEKLANVKWSPCFSCAFHFVSLVLLFALIFTSFFLFERKHEVIWREGGKDIEEIREGERIWSKYSLWKIRHLMVYQVKREPYLVCYS